jgi:ADP-heptose:LPS heptosyltransferase
VTINHQKIKKICVIQLQPFGDVFLTTSYFEVLKNRYPDAEIVFLTKAPYHMVLRDHPFINRLIIIPKASGFKYTLERFKSFFKIFAERFDLVIDQQYKMSSQHLCLASMARYRIGYNRERTNIPWAYNIQVPHNPERLKTYSATNKFDLLAPLGIEKQPYKMYLTISDAEQQKIDAWLASHVAETPFVLFSPGSREAFKRWGPQGFAQVADGFASQGFTPVFIWAPGEEPTVETVRGLMKHSSVLALPTSLQEGVALVKRAKLLVTNDGGLNHLSVVAEVPTIAIFGKTSPNSWSPATAFKTHHHFHNPKRDPNDPLWGIDPQEVLALGRSLITNHVS